MSSLPGTVYKIHQLLGKSWLTMKRLRMYSMVESLLNKYKATDLPPNPSTTVKQSQQGLGVYYSSVSKVHTVPIRNWGTELDTWQPCVFFCFLKSTKAVQERQRNRWNPGVCKPARQAQLSSPRSLWESLSPQNRSKQQNKATKVDYTWRMHLSRPPAPCTHTCIHRKTKTRIPH